MTGCRSGCSLSADLLRSSTCSTSRSSWRACPALVSSVRRAWTEIEGDGMKAQRVDMFVCPSATPADTSGLQELADAGKLKPDTLVALVGKTEGTGAHDDWGRVWADVALREWTARFLGVPVDEVSRHVIFVLSGGCPGVITPHVAAVTREWVEVPEQSGGAKRPVVGRAGSDPMPPEE